MASPRTIERLQARILERAANALEFELSDPRGGFITVTRVQLAKDLSSGKIYYSVLGSEADRRKVAHMLESAAGFLQRAIGRGLQLRRIPHLTWVYDELLRPDELIQNGHCSFTRDGRWMLTDTGPDENSLRTVYLWDMLEERKVILGRFLSPPPFRGEIRCDPHPRWSRDESQICFDSVHAGTRQVYVVDVSEITG